MQVFKSNEQWIFFICKYRYVSVFLCPIWRMTTQFYTDQPKGSWVLWNNSWGLDQLIWAVDLDFQNWCTSLHCSKCLILRTTTRKPHIIFGLFLELIKELINYYSWIKLYTAKCGHQHIYSLSTFLKVGNFFLLNLKVASTCFIIQNISFVKVNKI